MVKLDLNTVCHTEEDIAKAAAIINVMGKDFDKGEANAYASMLIFSNFNIEKTNVMFDLLKYRGYVTEREFMGVGSDLVGWTKV